MMSDVTVIKLRHNGSEKWRWSGRLLRRERDAATAGEAACVEGFFNLDDHDNGLMVLRRGDRYIEWYYTHRRYNVFDIYDRDTGARKGWYCDLCRPAVFTDDASGLTIRFEDLELDLIILPDGTLHLVDEADFAAAPLADSERAAVWAAVDDIRAQVAAADAPFSHPLPARF